MSYSQQGEASNSTPAPSAAEVYDTTRFGELYYGSRQPRVHDLCLAATFLIQIFERAGIPFAFLGGWAMYMRGSPRQTQDVDIAVGTTMENLTTLLLQLSVPLTHGQTSIQIFIHTGGQFDTGYDAYAVSTDIVIGGNLNTPRDIPDGTELITPAEQARLGYLQIRVVDIFFQFHSKLDAFNTRRATGNTGNDYRDLQWLLRQYPNEIYHCRYALNYNHRSLFFQDLATENQHAPEYVNYVKTLLGLD
ncbi:hypothetical protein L207DRAFT_591481 [Hyaloscypha variabilis F]|uniref:Uncharacterized protein n=1 Tax=Hyaloscypha variabilis (strain UAMH 11265 / GT02V1 / F) TaxID=1149755 RepID=A0A2J6QZ65_HYAVF|nr:hypothetical protein L207DRAFT_591481 [Hyaloscypha variabilis F]